MESESASVSDLHNRPSLPQRFAESVPKGAVPLAFRMIAYTFAASIGYLIAHRCGGKVRICLLTASITGGATVLFDQTITKKIKRDNKKPAGIKQKMIDVFKTPPRVGREVQQARRLCRDIRGMTTAKCTEEWLEEINQQMDQGEEYDLPDVLRKRLEQSQEKLEPLREYVATHPLEEISEEIQAQRRLDDRLETRLKRANLEVLDAPEGPYSLLAALETALYRTCCIEYALYSKRDGERLKQDLLDALRAPEADASVCAPLIEAVESGRLDTCRGELLSFISRNILNPQLPIEVYEANEAFRKRPTQTPAPSRYPPPPKSEIQEAKEYRLGIFPHTVKKSVQPEEMTKGVASLQLLYRRGNQQYKGLFIDPIAQSLGQFAG